MAAIEAERVQRVLCKELCASVVAHERGDGRVYVETPFVLGDGDAYGIYLEAIPSGGVRITDCGTTLMSLSYSMDVDSLREGTRGRLFEQVLRDAGVSEDGGQVYVDSSMAHLGADVVRFGQVVTQLRDLSFLNRVRVESTFAEDLAQTLEELVSSETIHRDYVCPGIANAEDYPVDFMLEGRNDPLFIWGITGRDKARLATLIIEHLLRERVQFDSLLVFSNQEEIGRGDLARLSNVGGEMVSSLAAKEDLRRKVQRKVA